MNRIIEILSAGFGKSLIVAVIFLFSFVSFTNASAIKVPLNIQAAMIVKLVKYNNKFQGKNRVKMLIVYTSKTVSEKDDMYSELSNSMELKAVHSESAENIGKDYDLIYFMPGCEEKAYICKENKSLSVSSAEKLVKQGDISIAIATENDKPRIFVNLSSLKAEEQNLSNDILNICKVYK